MKNHYIPSVTEAHSPEDGGWTNYDDTNVLLLSVPSFKNIVHIENKGYSYSWLWDDETRGYIFCFKLNSGEERAIFFTDDYAGKLLKEPEGQEVFHIALTSSPLKELDDETSVLWLPGIELKAQS
jgi:hypothetical protein